MVNWRQANRSQTSAFRISLHPLTSSVGDVSAVGAIVYDITDQVHAEAELRRSENYLRKIVEIQLALVQDRLAERAVTLAVSDAGLDWLADHGYDPAYGARPLKRLIQTAIANPLAIKLLEGSYPEGSTIQVDVQGDELTIL